MATWIEAERESRGAGVKQERSSMFTVFFGVNDVWKYSGYDRVDGIAAVDASLDSMFEQLDLVDQHWPDPIQVLVPYLPDVWVTLPPLGLSLGDYLDNMGAGADCTGK